MGKCSLMDPCVELDCINGSCSNGACSCIAGFTGSRCQHNIDECNRIPCGNDGRCVDMVNSYECQCNSGFTGTNCETNIDDCPGSCDPTNTNRTEDRVNDCRCICKGGYTGVNCTETIDECISYPCQHGGTCIDGDNDYICNCTTGWEGKNCQSIKNYCADSPCSKSGHCYNLYDGRVCRCHGGTRGETCDDAPPLCNVVQPCVNSGVCYDAEGTTKCNCTLSYTGQSCQLIKDHCTPSSNPCKSTGTCVTEDAGYTCSCNSGYSGSDCGTVADLCSSVSCPSGTTCTQISEVDTVCYCDQGRVLTDSGCKVSDTNYDILFDMMLGDKGASLRQPIIHTRRDISITLWVKAVKNSGTSETYVFQMSTTEPSVQIFNINVTHLIIRDSWSMTMEAVSLGTNLNDGDWHHIVVFWRNSSMLTLMVDAVTIEDNTEVKMINTSLLMVSNINIGEHFSGRISQVVVWDMILSKADVYRLFGDRSFTPSVQPLQAWTNYRIEKGGRLSYPSAAKNNTICDSPVCFTGKSMLKLLSCEDDVYRYGNGRIVSVNNRNQASFSGQTTVNSSLPEGDSYTYGSYPEIIVARDTYGNFEVCRFKVYIQYNNVCQTPETDGTITPCPGSSDSVCGLSCPVNSALSRPFPIIKSCTKLGVYDVTMPWNKIQRLPNCGDKEFQKIKITQTMTYELAVPCDSTFYDNFINDVGDTFTSTKSNPDWGLCDVTCSNVKITPICPAVGGSLIKITVEITNINNNLTVSGVNYKPREVMRILTLENGIFNYNAIAGAQLQTYSVTIEESIWCPEGFVIVGDDCVNCGKGSYLDQTSMSCQFCPLGTYQDTVGSTNCTNCTSEKTTLYIGSARSSHCVDSCIPGYKYDYVSMSCQPCDRHEYQDMTNKDYCIPCPMNKGTNGTASNSSNNCFMNCGPGKEVDPNDSESCRKCPRGKYKDASMQFVMCSMCPPGNTTNSTGASSIEECDIATSTTIGPTMSSTTSVPTLPPVCLNNRTRTSNLMDLCGFHSANVICDVDNATCMTSMDDTWRCRCMKGFYQAGQRCEKVPDKIFKNGESDINALVTIDSNFAFTLVHSIDTTVNSSSTSCSVSNPDLFFCLNYGSHVGVFIRNPIALTVIADSYKVNVFVSTSVDNSVLSGQKTIIVKVTQPVLTFSVLVGDSIVPGQIIIHLPVTTDISLSLNDTRFELNDNYNIILVRDVKEVSDSSTLVFMIPIEVTENMSRRRAIVVVHVLRTRFEKEVPENIVETVAYIENSQLYNITLKGDDSHLFTTTDDTVRMVNALDYDGITRKELHFTVEIVVDDGMSADCEVYIKLIDEDDVSPKFSERTVTVRIVQSALMTFVMNLEAEDIDTRNLSYSLRPETSEFVIKNGFELWKKSALTGSNVTVVASDLVNAEDTMNVFVEVESPISQDLNLTFRANIDEEEPIGTHVLTIKADSHENFQFFDATSSAYFHLDNSTGNVTLARKIDRDTDKYLQRNNDILVFYVRATEKGTTCSFVNLGKIEVKIRDINDIAPSFTHAQYTGTVEEESSNQTLKIKPAIGIIDGDKANTFTFSFINYADTFGIRKISDTNIEIFTKREIDRDDGVSSTFTLHVQVFDGLNMNSTILTVSVLDINDNKPKYMNGTKSFSLKENSELSTPIAFLYYTDLDDGSNSDLVYGDDTGYFSVNDGILSVDGPIDRETISQHNISLTVCDRGNDPRCTVDNIIIYVEDVNDNSPTFVSPLGVTTVAENHSCSVDNVITKVSFVDADINKNGRLTYRIKSMANIFNISETTGDVYCIEELDFESITDTLYVVEIEACDNGIERKCSQTDVYIRVTDVNDNSPVFLGEFVSREYMTSVEASDFSSASSKPIALVSATDYDSGSNGELMYNIESGNGTDYVEIDNKTGLLKSKVQTNPTQGLTYSVLISVKDKGQSPLTNQTYVHFTIKQTSASFEFTQTDIVIKSVTEENLETAIVNLTQYIRNDNGVTLKYSIPSSQDLSFTVNEDSGIIDLTKKLDREVKDKHLFPVRASNDDASALALVTVIVRDINDNIPLIPADLRRIVALPEDTPTGTMFLNVTATDADIGNNALTRFTLDAESGSPEYCASSFRINETNGVVTLEKEVDFDDNQQRNTNTYCRFLIKAIDMGNSLFSSTASLTVEIRDVNDNVPRFVGTSYTLQIPEGATAAEKFVWGVYVTDADMKNSANGDVIVTIKNPGLCPFYITTKKIKDNDRSVTFSPKNNTDLDFETNERFDCELLARDKGSPTLESNVSMVITLTDVNDNAPMVLDGPYVLNVSRYVEGDPVILQRINAKDMDVGENARLTFRKADDDSDNVFWDYFSISALDGKIRVDKRLKSLDVDEIVLSVNISDNGSPVLYTVYPITIQLEDDNQRPYFGRLPVSVNVSLVEETRYLKRQSIFENIPGFPRTALDDQKSGTVVCDCEYYLQYHDEIFEVDQITADIYLKDNKSIDREINSSVTLQLIGRDNGLPPQQTIPPIIVYINIYDVNDNPPVFTQSNYQAVIFQDYPLHSDVFTVRAMDRDKGDNAVTQYTIISVTPAPDVAGNFNQSAFSIHSNNGTIFLNSSVYLKTTDTYFFVITVGAYDVNKPTYTDTARVTVTVEYNDPNLHTPVFSQAGYQHELMLSDTSPGDYILTVTATDRDTDSKLGYSITEGNVRDTFGISRDSGNITLRYPIDQRVFDRLQDPNSKNFKLTVIALDNGVIPKTGTATVTITLKDNPQPCNLGLRQQQTTTTSAPVPDDPGFQIAMFVLIGIVSALLISNTVFILKYCRSRSVPVRKKGTYAGYDSKRLTKQHDYDGFQNNREQHGQYPGNNQDWTANPAYGSHNVSREAHINRGFHDDGRSGPPPSLPPRPEFDPRFNY